MGGKGGKAAQASLPGLHELRCCSMAEHQEVYLCRWVVCLLYYLPCDMSISPQKALLHCIILFLMPWQP